MLITYWSMKYVHVYKHAQTHTLTHTPVRTQRIIPGWLACCTQSKVNYARIMTQIIILEWKGEFTWFPIDTAVGIPFANACPSLSGLVWIRRSCLCFHAIFGIRRWAPCYKRDKKKHQTAKWHTNPPINLNSQRVQHVFNLLTCFLAFFTSF